MRLVCVIVVLALSAPFAAASGPVWPDVIVSSHLTQDSARKYAAAQAVHQIGDYLRQLDPPVLDWQPTEDYVREKLVQGPGAPGDDISIDAGQTAKTWIIKLKPPDVVEFRRLNQQALEARWRRERGGRAEDRLALMGWGFLGVAAGLGAVMVWGWVRGRGSARG